MSRRIMTRRWAPALGLAALVALMGFLISCDSERGVLDPGEVPGPNFEVYDGSALGTEGFENVNPHFYFLPPVVSSPTTSGVFDDGVNVRVEVLECGLYDPSTLSDPEPDSGLKGNRRICYGDPVQVAWFDRNGGFDGNERVLVSDLYQVDWHTDLSDVSTDQTPEYAKFYRIVVFFNHDGDLFPIGHVDVQFGQNGAVAKNINQENADVFGLNDGRTLPIKFRIEESAATFAELSSCHDDETGEIIDCEVKTLDSEASEDQTLVVESYDDQGNNGEGVEATFTPGALSNLPPGVEVTAVIRLVDPDISALFPPSPEIPDDYELPPFVSVELYDQNGDEYNTTLYPLGGTDPDEGLFLEFCYEVDPGLEGRAIYKVDRNTDDPPTPQTVLLETASNAACEWLGEPSSLAYAPQEDESFLERLQSGLSRVASLVQPDPLKAGGTGVNTMRPVRRLSEFGQVDLSVYAYPVGEGAVGSETEITFELQQLDPDGVSGGPVGGDVEGGGLFVGPGDEQDTFVEVTITGANPTAPVTIDDFNPVGDGTYTARYTPTATGTDQITVTAGTYGQISTTVQSQVFGNEGCVGDGTTLDCDFEDLIPGTQTELVVEFYEDGGVGDGEGVEVTLTPDALPSPLPDGVETVTAVVRYIDPSDYYPSPEIPDDYEISPFVSVELFDQDGNEYNTQDNPLGGADPDEGLFLEICYDWDVNPDLEGRAIYKVDRNETVPASTQTVLLETESGATCEWLVPPSPVVYAPQEGKSFLGRLQNGLSRVASLVQPDPLKAGGTGVNTMRPVRRLSEFGQVDLSVFAYEVGPGQVGSETEISFELRQLDPDGVSWGPVGGDPEGGGLHVGPGDDQDTFVEVTITGANPTAPITIDEFDPAGGGTYTARYTPTAAGTDDITVTVGTYVPQTTTVQSQVTCPVPSQLLGGGLQATGGAGGSDGLSQSFVACEGGSVNAVAVFVHSISGVPSGGASFGIQPLAEEWDPSANGGYTQDGVTLIPGEWNTIILDTPFPVLAGAHYQFAVYATTGTFTLGSYTSETLGYPGGDASWINSVAGTITGITPPPDLQFEVNPELPATLRVTVTDGLGAVLPGISVTLVDVGVGFTDVNGLVQFDDVPVGVYDLIVGGNPPQQVDVSPGGSIVDYTWAPGCDPAIVEADGLICGSEWSGATYYDVTVLLDDGVADPSSVPARLYLTNDADSLYAAVRFERNMNDGIWVIGMLFDNDNNGTWDVYEDEVLSQWNGNFWDAFRSPTSGVLGVDPIQDGSWGFTYASTYTFWEVSHPLNSGEEYDMSVGSGDSFGVQFLINHGPPSGPPVTVHNYFPATGFYVFTVQ